MTMVNSGLKGLIDQMFVLNLSKCEFLLLTHPTELFLWGRILVQATIYRRLLIGRDGHLDQSVSIFFIRFKPKLH